MGRKIKLAAGILFLLLFFWIIMGVIDFSRVNCQKTPIFCMETKQSQYCHYAGLGYSFDTVQNPFSKNVQYVFYLFGMEVNNNFTN